MKDNLKEFAKNYYSQWGEDGILEEILKRLSITDYSDIWVVEFGAWDGKHLSNTFNLIEKGASAVLIEGDKNRFDDLLKTKNEFQNIIPINSFVTATGEQSLNKMLDQTPIKQNYEILSIDVDSYENLEIWKNYKGSPTIVVIEINSSFLPHEKNIKNELGNTFFETNKVGEQKGYKLVAHTPNMIFIKKDEVPKIYKYISYNSYKLFNYGDFLRWRNISRIEIVKLLFSGAKYISFTPLFIKLLPQKIKIKIYNRFY